MCVPCAPRPPSAPTPPCECSSVRPTRHYLPCSLVQHHPASVPIVAPDTTLQVFSPRRGHGPASVLAVTSDTTLRVFSGDRSRTCCPHTTLQVFWPSPPTPPCECSPSHHSPPVVSTRPTPPCKCSRCPSVRRSCHPNLRCARHTTVRVFSSHHRVAVPDTPPCECSRRRSVALDDLWSVEKAEVNARRGLDRRT